MGQGNPHRQIRFSAGGGRRSMHRHGRTAPYVPNAHLEQTECRLTPGKIAFRTPKRAARLLDRLRRIDGAVGMMVYKCDGCLMFHLGHDNEKHELGERRRVRAVKQQRTERNDTNESEIPDAW